MRQIVYFSTAAGQQDANTVAAIWALTREQYRRDGLSGLLVAGGHRYLEVIEGRVDEVELAVDRIRFEQRHVGMSVLITRRIAERSFPDWSATYFTAPPTRPYATLGDMVERMRGLVSDPALLDQLNYLERRFAVAPAAPLASPWTTAACYGALPLDRRH